MQKNAHKQANQQSNAVEEMGSVAPAGKELCWGGGMLCTLGLAVEKCTMGWEEGERKESVEKGPSKRQRDGGRGGASEKKDREGERERETDTQMRGEGDRVGGRVFSPQVA